MPNSLFLTPTEFERRKLGEVGTAEGLPAIEVEVCGFGVVAAAAGATRLIDKHQPSEVILVGIAGRISPELQIGSAYEFTSVACYGIGAGSGSSFRDASELGWEQFGWSGEVLDLSSNSGQNLQLLTSCSITSSAKELEIRSAKVPAASAEDMEAYAVAWACRYAGLKLRVMRGISNSAGDRELSNWQVDKALLEVSKLLHRSFG